MDLSRDLWWSSDAPSSSSFVDESRPTERPPNAFEEVLERRARRSSRRWTSESSSDSSLSEHLDRLFYEYKASFRGAESPPVSSSLGSVGASSSVSTISGPWASSSTSRPDLPSNFSHASRGDDCIAFHENGIDYEYCPPDDEPNLTVPPIRRKKNKKPLATECVFCKNNELDEESYRSHILKDQEGRTICPILRKYKCPMCGAIGDEAHTVKYCPLRKTSTTL